MPLASLRLQFGGDSGLQLCCQRVILLGNKVASGPGERGKQSGLESRSALQRGAGSWQRPSSSPGHPSPRRRAARTQARTQAGWPANKEPPREAAGGAPAGLCFGGHSVSSFPTLLSHVLRDVSPLKKKQAAYLEANYYQMTTLQNIS